MEAPQNRRFYGKMEYFPLWPTYIGEKGRFMGLKWGVLITPLGNTLGTWWKLIGNLKGTCWEQWKNEKILPPNKLPISNPRLHKWYLVHFSLLQKNNQKEHESIASFQNMDNKIQKWHKISKFCNRKMGKERKIFDCKQYMNVKKTS